MTYFNQEMKAAIAPKIKATLKKYGLKGSLSVRNNSSVVLTIKSGKINFFDGFNSQVSGGNIDVNPYHYRNQFDGVSRDALTELFDILNTGNWDNSDVMTDYFDRGWYVYVNIGKWNQAYNVVE